MVSKILIAIIASTLAVVQALPARHTHLKTRQGLKVYSTCTKPNTFALTFDDGLHEFGKSVVSTLDANDAKGTFFVNGNNFRCIYAEESVAQLKSRFDGGHLMASHGWGHVSMKGANQEHLHDQLWRVEEAFIRILGVKPLWFRAPFGDYDDLLLQVLAERGYKGMILWDQDSNDTATPAPDAATVIKSYEGFPAKTISLNHEVKQVTTDDVMPFVVPALKKRGFSLVTAVECIGGSANPADWYEKVGEPQARDEKTWTCVGTPAPGTFE